MILPFIIHIPAILFFAYLIKTRFASEPLSNYYWPGLIFKFFAGICIGLLYTYYYAYGDTLIMHIYSSKLTDILFNEPIQYFKIFFLNEFNNETKQIIAIHEEPRLLFYVKILSLLNIFTLKNYYINGLYLSFFSFSGLWFLGNTTIKIFNTSKPATAFSFLFFPSFVFWSSGVLKESFLMGAMAFIIFIVLNYMHLNKKINYKNISILILLLYCVWKIKFFYLIVLIPCMLSYYLVIIFQNKFERLRYSYIKACLSFIINFIFLSVIAITIHPSLNLNYLLNSIYESYIVILNETHLNGNHAFEFPGLKPELFNVLSYLPQALFIGLFRPFIWEGSKMALLPGIENLLILLLFIIQTFYLFSKKPRLKIIAFSTLFYVFVMAACMALIAPNWGTLLRYKVCFLPFLILLITNHNPLFDFIAKNIAQKIDGIKLKIFHIKDS